MRYVLEVVGVNPALATSPLVEVQKALVEVSFGVLILAKLASFSDKRTGVYLDIIRYDLEVRGISPDEWNEELNEELQTVAHNLLYLLRERGLVTDEKTVARLV